jgi:hypothetical protein
MLKSPKKYIFRQGKSGHFFGFCYHSLFMAVVAFGTFGTVS